MSGEIMVSRKKHAALRSLAVDCASGEWCVWLADDCWFAQTYIRAHMLAADKDCLTTVRNVTGYAVDTQRQTTCRVEYLTGFFRLGGKPKQTRAIDGRELVLHFIRERQTNSKPVPELPSGAHPI